MLGSTSANYNAVLLERLRMICCQLPPGILRGLAASIRSMSISYDQAESVIAGISEAGVRTLLPEVFSQARLCGILPEALALSLELAGTMAEARESERAELVWTGPGPHAVGMRRTEQALLDVIRAARQSLWLVSFAVFPVPELVQALERAVAREVEVNLLFETPENASGKLTCGGAACLKPELVSACRVYEWSPAHRAVDANGNAGVLHAKCAVADESMAFISSANLTGAAMSTNMELGILLDGGSVPVQLAAHLRSLVASRILEQVA